MINSIIDATSTDSKSSELTLSSEKTITMFVVAKSGREGNYRINLELSPDNGSTWIASDAILKRPGLVTIEAIATKARARVIVSEKTSSTIIVHLLAR